MSDVTSGDVLMYFVPKSDGVPIAAQSTSTLVGADARLMQGFVAGKYFDAENFSFGIELADDEGGSMSDDAEAGSYGRWRGLKDNQPKPTPPFRAEPNDASITRLIDASSPVLLRHCLDKDEFNQAVLVKRSRIGKNAMMSATLRIEFSKVWLKSIEWEDGDTVRETCKFKFASVKVTYVRRKQDGTVASLWPCEWTAYQSSAQASAKLR